MGKLFVFFVKIQYFFALISLGREILMHIGLLTLEFLLVILILGGTQSPILLWASFLEIDVLCLTIGFACFFFGYWYTPLKIQD